MTPPSASAAGKAADRARELVGQTIDGRYRIDEVIAMGAMGTVYLAHHLKLKKRVAMKVLHPGVEDHPELFLRFDREALAGAQVGHPNIACATDFGDLEGGARYLVMEYVKGRTLRDLLDADAPLAAERAAGIARQIFAALDHVHTRGIVHRDLKPRNVMLAEGDVVKVVDFGLAKIDGARLSTLPDDEAEEDQRLTARGVIFGTVEYLAPEAAFGMELVDARADLYAAGVILYEMLSGEHPFVAKTEAELFAKQRHAPPPRMSERVPGLAVDEALEKIVMKLLEKDFDERFQTAAEVIAALEAWERQARKADRKERKEKEKEKEKKREKDQEREVGKERGNQTENAPSEPPRAPGRSRATAWIAGGATAVAAALWIVRQPPPSRSGAPASAAPSASAAPPAPEPSARVIPSVFDPPTPAPAPVPASAAPDPAVRSALLDALKDATSKGAWDEAADTARELLAQDAKVLTDDRASKVVSELLVGLAREKSSKAEPTWRAFALAPGGADLLYKFIERQGKSQAAERARKLLGDPEVARAASAAVRISFELREADCQKKMDLLDRAVAEGDQRTVVVIDIVVRGCAHSPKPVDDALKKLRARIEKP